MKCCLLEIPGIFQISTGIIVGHTAVLQTMGFQVQLTVQSPSMYFVSKPCTINYMYLKSLFALLIYVDLAVFAGKF